MTMNFTDRLRQTCVAKKSMLCVGLDPDPAKFPEGIAKTPDGIFQFCKEIIGAVAEYSAAFKPNLAFFEAFGSEGIKALEKTLSIIPKDVIVIADAKRSDIGNTSQKYSEAVFKTWGFDAITVNPLLGKDSVEPFLIYEDKGVFILCLTSNKGAADFQMPNKLYLNIIKNMSEINGKNNCGLVVGATHPEYLKEIRQKANDMPFLIPGVGAQGGDLNSVIENAADSKGLGYIINSSRAIIYASSGKDFADKARENARKTRDEINNLMNK